FVTAVCYTLSLHDALPILDRAGLVGEDGATHHGVFDIPFLRCIPNMMIAAPSNELQLRNLLYTVQKGLNGPIAIRYPRGRGMIPDRKSTRLNSSHVKISYA